MLSASTRALVKATVPVLQQHGVALTSHFYRRMFEHNPELKHLFNQGHQHSGQQQQALAMAVLAYAQHIDDPSPLLPVLTRVAHKHVSLGIRAEHYPIVGKHLLASIREVLGDAAGDDLIQAWAEAYGQLAALMAGLENDLYRDTVNADGGWSGWRPFRVVRKEAESEEIASFYLEPSDGGALPGFRPGQYVSVKRFVPEWGLSQPRQYSLSDAPNGEHLRISVKREDAGPGKPAGRMSNLLHREVAVGDVLELSAPQGDFCLNEDGAGPVVLISAGVGQTPMLAMLGQLLRQGGQREIRFLHAARHGGAHAMKHKLRQLAERHARLKLHICYEQPRAQDLAGVDYHAAGRLQLDALRELALLPDADYYLCGPLGFMDVQRGSLLRQGVAPARIHYEVFGSNPSAD
ncbi:NO-inducible flavohemoprotein [Chromobacterium subtsugae]|uniref:Flavohemoprotein n=1 Tax=Chromobacterium subtsugae TaxID=251747 RepID=A0ABS7FIV5_9NEIS|nr:MULTISPECIES: NO-inducible flavohemoprotein [Chromobacterium]KUM02080.1 dihydropteridine reductase [Chromobacterium subtsugae]KZE86514.1 nitric oxide dioxygenase [Chromobacterium sp. F49]MBW7568975.1 NO-inducible flavohemoprotein [Chromobacterium subtsugae]MBW8290012.1 NO-inducible flavohemoprotein [Chromobacterium subtsugae]OBU88308.1 dihydropteridine reductase [Chromobacterium subtsugae]